MHRAAQVGNVGWTVASCNLNSNFLVLHLKVFHAYLPLPPPHIQQPSTAVK